MTVFEAFAGLAPAASSDVAATRRLSWRGSYLRTAFAADCLVAAAAATLASVLTGASMGAALPLLWPAVFALAGAYRASVISIARAENRALAVALATVFSGLAAISYLTGAPVGRGIVLAALPVLALGTYVARLGTRALLLRRTATGTLARRVLLIGAENDVRNTAKRLRSTAGFGTVVAGLVPALQSEDLLLEEGVPLLAGLDRLGTAIDLVEADTVLIAPGSMSPTEIRELGWSLEGKNVDLAVLPGLHDVEARRLSLRVEGGLPILAVEAPRRAGLGIAVKHGLDRMLGAMLLVCAAPVLLAVAAAVRFGSSGPAIFRQERVGKDGRTFVLYKFRTMVIDAEAQRDILLVGNDADGPLFKLREDPRVTRVGRLLRKHSLDELPQLLNVVKGEMSLVGPRPPLPVEVAAYSSDVRRRLLVRPGLTGLWQVSGRSDLSWEDSVRLDLRYVDNVSLGLDAGILGRTLRTVVKGSGAY